MRKQKIRTAAGSLKSGSTLSGLKKADATFIGIILLFASPFIISNSFFESYLHFNHHFPFVASFIKFAILATLGEVIGLRIKSGSYYQTDFGVLPRAIVWGVLGITIKMAFIIFANGVPVLLTYMGLAGATTVLSEGMSAEKLLVAFSISLIMNIIFAPLMMTFHKVTDIHILSNGGTLKGFFRPIKFQNILLNLNWEVQWNFVFLKTIPYFWIPAHTITFLLPQDFQVLFAAILGIALGTILAIADMIEK